jgi:hypothetical protein
MPRTKPADHGELHGRVLAELDRQIESAGQALVRAAPGESLCMLDRQRRVRGGAKYQEGRFTALRECQRTLVNPNAPVSAAVLDGALRAVHERWRTLLETHLAKESPSQAWVAYAQGGCDGCTSARQLVHRTSRALAAVEKEENL